MFTFIKNHRLLLASLVVIVLVVSLVFYGFHHRKPNNTQNEQPNQQLSTIIQQDTTISLKPKTSKDDVDLEVNQRYKASINGTTVEIPLVTTGTTDSSKNNKVSVSQEIDMTKVINTALTLERQKVQQEYKKNWEIGIGIGQHNGDLYVPLELQRNYAKDRAVSIEVHMDTNGSVNGYELKHKWKF